MNETGTGFEWKLFAYVHVRVHTIGNPTSHLIYRKLNGCL